MKKTLVFAISLLFALGAYPDKISKEAALVSARHFAETRCASFCQQSDSQRRRSPEKTVTAKEVLTTEGCYVFNINEEKDGGFVVVAADDRLPLILGYADSGAFPSELPQTVASFLKAYDDRLASGSVRSSAATWTPVREAIEPLLATRWNQNSPFNSLCPKVQNVLETATGCVATAMAQAVNHLAQQAGGQPQRLVKDIPGYTTGRFAIEVPAVEADFGFDWANMASEYQQNRYTAAQGTAVAQLMQCCATALQADFGPSNYGGTSAYASDMPSALSYFGMTALHALRSNYSYRQWAELLYDELTAGRPVVYAGQSSGGGHCFVVDGYDGDEMYHINWGWGGLCDGFFLLTEARPGSSEGIGASTSDDGYAYSQEAVVGLALGSGQTSEGRQLTFRNVAVAGNKVTFSPWNNSDEGGIFSYGIGWMDTNGTISSVSGSKTLQFYGHGLLPNESVTIPAGSRPAGRYVLVTASKVASESQWLTEMNGETSYIEAIFSDNGNVTLMLHPQISFQVEMAFGGTLLEGAKVPVELNITNLAEEYYGCLYLFASKTALKGVSKSLAGVTLGEGQSAKLSLSFTPEEAGDYNVWIATDEDGDNVVAQGQVTIGRATIPTGDIMLANVSFDNADGEWTLDGDGNFTTDIYGALSATVTMAIKNISGQTLTNVAFGIDVYAQQGSEWVACGNRLSYSTPQFAAGLTIKFTPMTLSTGGRLYGTFKLVLTKDGNIVDDRYHFNLVEGIDTWTANGGKGHLRPEADGTYVIPANVAAADFSKLLWLSASVTPNDNPNTLYYFTTQSIPSSLQGRNIVSNTTAGSITLADGWPFYCPEEFHAGTISYSRTMGTGLTSSATGWESLVLPFAAEGIALNGSDTIDWFRSSTDGGKHFWLMDFVGDTSGAMYFDCAGEIKAYHPYLLAVPGMDYGTASLAGRTLTFTASNATVAPTQAATRSGSHFKFRGSLATAAYDAAAYAIDADKAQFLRSALTAEPFRAAPAAIGSRPAAVELRLSSQLPTALQAIQGIATVKAGTKPATEASYSLTGRKAKAGQKGIIINGGKKTIK